MKNQVPVFGLDQGSFLFVWYERSNGSVRLQQGGPCGRKAGNSGFEPCVTKKNIFLSSTFKQSTSSRADNCHSEHPSKRHIKVCPDTDRLYLKRQRTQENTEIIALAQINCQLSPKIIKDE